MSKTRKVTREDWRFREELEKIVESGCKEVPYEGTDVDKSGIVEDIMELLTSKKYSLLNHETSKHKT